MGYMGLEHFGESDNASRLAIDVTEAIAKILKKGLKEKDNCFNTSGCVNVGLVLESLLESSFFNESHDQLIDIVDDTINALDKLIEKSKDDELWEGDKNNKNYHLGAYRRLRNRLYKYCEKE